VNVPLRQLEVADVHSKHFLVNQFKAIGFEKLQPFAPLKAVDVLHLILTQDISTSFRKNSDIFLATLFGRNVAGDLLYRCYAPPIHPVSISGAFPCQAREAPLFERAPAHRR
jgi:hypothetical protein